MMTIRMRGLKAALRTIARRFRAAYSELSFPTRSNSFRSAVKLLTVAMPEIAFASRVFRSPTFSRTSAYRGSSFRWNQRDPPITIGTGIIANHATSGEMMKKATVTVIAVTAS